MVYNNDKPFVAKSVEQMQKEYMITPFNLRNFCNGSQFTIVENHLKKSPLRFKTEISKKTNKPYSVYLIKINDGYITKDLSLFGDEVIELFRTLPETIVNIKDVTFANQNGKWVFICQNDGQIDDAPKSNQIAASMEEAPTEIGSQIKQLHQALLLNKQLGTKTDESMVKRIADLIRPGDCDGLIKAAKLAGMIVESNGIFRAE